jgi:hypothetical protein
MYLPKGGTDRGVPQVIYALDPETLIGRAYLGWFCMKRQGVPVATLTGVPAVLSKATTLNVTVAGANVVSYQYSLVQGTSCASASYSNEFFPVATKITAPLGADGAYSLCIKGKSSEGYTRTVPTQKSWTKDTVPPTAVTLAGTPENPSTTTNLNVTVSGGIDLAKYQVALKNGTGCAGVTYSAARAITTPITNAVGAAGPKTLCVKGIDAAGNIQTTPTQYSWTRQ